MNIINSHEQSIQLIALYSNYKILWDPKDPMYLNKNKRDACWRQISLEMKLPARELKKKMDSLLGSYRREKSREKKRRINDSVPRHEKVRKKWCRIMKRDDRVPLSSSSCLYCCEDHFNVEEDMENYVKYKLVGGMIKLKSGVMPHKFDCQKDKKEAIPKPAYAKRRAGNSYTSKWFGYRYFDFMKNKNEPGDTQDTISIEESQQSPGTLDPLIDIQDTSLNQSQLSPSTTNAEAPQTFPEEQHIEDTSTCTISSPQQPPSKKRRNNSKAQSQLDSSEMMLSEALRYLQKSSDEANDPYLSFGKHIANELTKYDPRTLSYVKNAINNIIFEADLGKYQLQQQPTPGYCTQNVQSPQSPSTRISTPTPDNADTSHAI